jgi:flagellar basal-body rod protein FlgF
VAPPTAAPRGLHAETLPMDTPGYIILSRLGAQMRATEVLASNLANADTPGFRALRPVFTSSPETQRGVGGHSSGRQVHYALDRATWRDDAAGPINATGNPLDLAIRGTGWFAVETPNGERYTRAGRFALDADRRIVDAEGRPVLGAAGPISLAVNDTRIEIQGDGTVRSENGVVGRLRVVRFGNEQGMRSEGDSLFASDDPPETVERPNVVQGAIEGSNVNGVLEMVRLTGELREFQFATQFAEREGERLGLAIDRILRRR